MPDALEVKRLLYEDGISPEAIRMQADTFLEQNRLNEAASLYARINDHDTVQLIVKKAIAEGNFFLFAACHRADRKEMDPQLLQELSANARTLGKLAYAEQAEQALHGSNEEEYEDEEEE